MSKQLPTKIEIQRLGIVAIGDGEKSFVHFEVYEAIKEIANKFNSLIDYLSEQGGEKSLACKNCGKQAEICLKCATYFEKQGKERCAKCNNPFENHHKVHLINEKLYHTGCKPKEKPVETEWEKEVEKKFGNIWGELDEQIDVSSLIEFISSLLSTTIQEERARVKKIIEKVTREYKYTNIKFLSDLLDRLLDEKN